MSSADLPGWLSQLQRDLDAEVIQTHISWLLLTPEVVYKVKKPLRLDFLDYSSMDLRRHYCAEEVRLNSRYAPQLYLGVVELGPSREPAVKMRRFNEADRADHVCARGELTELQLQDLVAQVIRLHAQAAAAPPGGRLGSPALIAQQIDTVLDDVADTEVVNEASLESLAACLSTQAADLADAIAARQRQGCIREGHGDLHLANVLVRDDVVTLFDGIEFSEELRWIDIANELAFTYADLLGHNRPDLAAALVMAWLEETADVEGLALLRFYGAYRCTIRAMAAGMQGDAMAAQHYRDLALRLAQPESRPRLLITHGLSGSGKSFAARRIVLSDPDAATIWLRSDIERKRLFGLAPHESSHSALTAGIYSEEATERCYAELTVLARVALQAGWSVVVDATFADPTQRELFRSLATACGADFGILACSAPEAELRARIARRRGDASEATEAVLERQLATFAPLLDHELCECVPFGVAGGDPQQ